MDTVASGQLATPTCANGIGNGSYRTPRARRDQGTPSGADFLRGVHESPDPLDTISPAPSVAKQRTLTPAIVDSNGKPSVSPARTTHRNDNRSLVDGENESKAEGAAGLPPTRDSKSDGEPASDTRSERRSLRSTNTGSRCKSELAQYFHNYEQIISLDVPEPGK